MASFISVYPPVERSLGISMGLATDNTARTWRVQRKHQDELAMLSHVKCCKAQNEGYFDPFIAPVGPNGKYKRDNIPRQETTMAKLARLRPCFAKDGTITAGNATANSDGSACVFLCSED